MSWTIGPKASSGRPCRRCATSSGRAAARDDAAPAGRSLSECARPSLASSPWTGRSDMTAELEALVPASTSSAVDARRHPDALGASAIGCTTSWLSQADSSAVPHALRPDRHRRAHRAPTATTSRPRDFTVVYHLLSFERNADVRIKVALAEQRRLAPDHDRSLAGRELVRARSLGHVRHRLRRATRTCARILMPPTWEGHPLRKDHPARATEMDPFQLPEAREDAEQEALRFQARRLGHAARSDDDDDFMFLNLGPNHPGAHGVLRIVLQLDGEEIVDAVPDIGYHHRGAEKMGERQSWHTYIPYTDRIDYLGGVMNNLPYVLAVEKLAGIEVPDRVKVIRVMLAEFFRIASHLVFYGTFAQDVGAMSPVFFMFTDRERALRHHRGDLRRPHAPELVPHRRRCAGSAAGLGPSGRATSSTICRRGSTSTTRS